MVRRGTGHVVSLQDNRVKGLFLFLVSVSLRVETSVIFDSVIVLDDDRVSRVRSLSWWSITDRVFKLIRQTTVTLHDKWEKGEQKENRRPPRVSSRWTCDKFRRSYIDLSSFVTRLKYKILGGSVPGLLTQRRATTGPPRDKSTLGQPTEVRWVEPLVVVLQRK